MWVWMLPLHHRMSLSDTYQPIWYSQLYTEYWKNLSQLRADDMGSLFIRYFHHIYYLTFIIIVPIFVTIDEKNDPKGIDKT